MIVSAVLHGVALLVSVACLLLSLRRIREKRWREFVIDCAMVAIMIATVFAPVAFGLTLGATLIALALVEAILARVMGAARPLHVHRSMCLVIMGAAVISMSAHEQNSSAQFQAPFHPHVMSMSLVGVIGLATVILIAMFMRRRFTLSAVGMLVATGLMSVATVAA